MTLTVAPGADTELLYGNFAFTLQVERKTALWPSAPRDGIIAAFSEVSGLEASMEHRVVREGGVNYGARLRPGPVSFGTIILKRGIARSQLLWKWWARFAGADNYSDGYADARTDLLIGLLDNRAPAPPAPPAGGGAAGDPPPRSVAMGWRIVNAMPIKFRVGDLNARGGDIAVEEIHLAHEGLHVSGVVPAAATAAAAPPPTGALA